MFGTKGLIQHAILIIMLSVAAMTVGCYFGDVIGGWLTL